MRCRLSALTVALVASYASATAAEESYRPTPVITYTISIPRPQTHLFHVDIDIKDVEEDTLALSIPVWSTGYYRIADFAGSVTEFEARDVSGKKLEWKKSDKIGRRGQGDSRTISRAHLQDRRRRQPDRSAARDQEEVVQAVGFRRKP